MEEGRKEGDQPSSLPTFGFYQERVCKVFGIRPPPPLVGGVSHRDFDLFALQPRRDDISVEVKN